MIRMMTVQTQFIFQNCIEPEGTFSQTGSHIDVSHIARGVLSDICMVSSYFEKHLSVEKPVL